MLKPEEEQGTPLFDPTAGEAGIGTDGTVVEQQEDLHTAGWRLILNGRPALDNDVAFADWIPRELNPFDVYDQDILRVQAVLTAHLSQPIEGLCRTQVIRLALFGDMNCFEINQLVREHLATIQLQPGTAAYLPDCEYPFANEVNISVLKTRVAKAFKALQGPIHHFWNIGRDPRIIQQLIHLTVKSQLEQSDVDSYQTLWCQIQRLGTAVSDIEILYLLYGIEDRMNKHVLLSTIIPHLTLRVDCIQREGNSVFILKQFRGFLQNLSFDIPLLQQSQQEGREQTAQIKKTNAEPAIKCLLLAAGEAERRHLIIDIAQHYTIQQLLPAIQALLEHDNQHYQQLGFELYTEIARQHYIDYQLKHNILDEHQPDLSDPISATFETLIRIGKTTETLAAQSAEFKQLNRLGYQHFIRKNQAAEAGQIKSFTDYLAHLGKITGDSNLLRFGKLLNDTSSEYFDSDIDYWINIFNTYQMTEEPVLKQRAAALKRLFKLLLHAGIFIRTKEDEKLPPYPYPLASLLKHGHIYIEIPKSITGWTLLNLILIGEANTTITPDDNLVGRGKMLKRCSTNGPGIKLLLNEKVSDQLQDGRFLRIKETVRGLISPWKHSYGIELPTGDVLRIHYREATGAQPGCLAVNVGPKSAIDVKAESGYLFCKLPDGSSFGALVRLLQGNHGAAAEEIPHYLLYDPAKDDLPLPAYFAQAPIPTREDTAHQQHSVLPVQTAKSFLAGPNSFAQALHELATASMGEMQPLDPSVVAQEMTHNLKQHVEHDELFTYYRLVDVINKPGFLRNLNTMKQGVQGLEFTWITQQATYMIRVLHPVVGQAQSESYGLLSDDLHDAPFISPLKSHELPSNQLRGVTLIHTLMNQLLQQIIDRQKQSPPLQHFFTYIETHARKEDETPYDYEEIIDAFIEPLMDAVANKAQDLVKGPMRNDFTEDEKKSFNYFLLDYKNKIIRRYQENKSWPRWFFGWALRYPTTAFAFGGIVTGVVVNVTANEIDEGRAHWNDYPNVAVPLGFFGVATYFWKKRQREKELAKMGENLGQWYQVDEVVDVVVVDAEVDDGSGAGIAPR